MYTFFISSNCSGFPSSKRAYSFFSPRLYPCDFRNAFAGSPVKRTLSAVLFVIIFSIVTITSENFAPPNKKIQGFSGFL